jgi:RNA-directed DNA polymerase
LRTYERPNGKPAKPQITPSRTRLRALTAKGTALWKRTAGCTPAALIDPLNPILRGWATDHRHVIRGETFATRDNFVRQRLYRWARGRHSKKPGRWIAARDFPHQAGASWRFTDPVSGKQSIRVREAVKPQRHLKVQGDAHPSDPAWAAYFHHRDRQLTLQASAPGRAKILREQHGRGPVCRRVLQGEEALELHHREGHHQNNQWANRVFRHPTGHRQVHSAPARKTGLPRSRRRVGHA